MRETLFGMLQKPIRKDPHLRDHAILLAIIALLLSFCLIFVHSMAQGIADTYALLGSGHLSVSGSYEGPDAYPVRSGNALLYGSDVTAPVMVKGVSAEYFTANRKTALHVSDLDLNASGKPWVIISERIARTLSVSVGDSVLLVLSQDDHFRPVLGVVSAIYDSGYAELDDLLVFCPISVMEAAGYPLATELLVTGDVSSEEQRLRKQGYFVTAWYEARSDLAENLQTSQNVVTGVFLAIAMLAAFFVSEFSASMVTDRKTEIATLKLLGMRDRSVRRLFLVAVFRLSLWSLALGTVLGGMLAYVLQPVFRLLGKSGIPALSYYLLDFPILIPWGRIVIVLVVLLLLSMASASLALRRIRSIQPVSLVQGW
ncbi:MAG: FtsX-like permease family protein [Sphaerochaeta sp.]|jgi:ABC-type lipoprotein release transport system permease subunit|nr:FtsX-like permease family protein [Sphaerochaeta sp.]